MTGACQNCDNLATNRLIRFQREALANVSAGLKGERLRCFAPEGFASPVIPIFLPPASRTGAKMTREHQIEQTQRLVAALQGHFHHLGFARGEQIPGPGQSELGTLVTKGHADQLAEDAAQMSGSAMRPLRQLLEIHFEQFR